MDRAYESNQASNAPPAPNPPVLGYPTETGGAPTVPGAWWFHMITEELRAAIVSGGVAPSATTLNQLALSITNIADGAASAAVSGYATEAWVTSRGYAPLAGAAFTGQVTVNVTAGNYCQKLVAPNTVGQSYGLNIQAGTNGADGPIYTVNATNTFSPFAVYGNGQFNIGYNGSETTISGSSAGNVTIEPPGSGIALTVDGCAGNYAQQIIGAGVAGDSYGLLVVGGTNSSDNAFHVENYARTADLCVIYGDGHGFIGASQQNSLSWNADGNFSIAAPFAGGITLTIVGTLDATAIEVSGVPLATSATVDTTDAGNISSGTLPPARLPSSFSVSGTITAGAFNVSSDARIKRNIQVITNARERMKKLRGVTFERTETGETDAGVIAQEAREAFAESVLVGGDLLHVRVMPLIGLLVATVNELIAELEARP